MITISKEIFYNCKSVTLSPPENFIKFNLDLFRYKNEISVDECLADEVKDLWNKGIKTTGCCCGHGKDLGYIEVADDCIEKMRELGYQNYIYPTKAGGESRKDAFIPKSYGHIFDGYHERFYREGMVQEAIIPCSASPESVIFKKREDNKYDIEICSYGNVNGETLLVTAQTVGKLPDWAIVGTGIPMETYPDLNKDALYNILVPDKDW